MKKTAHLLLLSVAAAAVASCSENTEFEENFPAGDGEIRFQARTEHLARRSDITTNTLDEFYVYAYTGMSSIPKIFMDNVTVTKTASNTWAYSPLKYWPVGAVDFFAYAPEGWVGSAGPLEPVPYSNYGSDKDLIYSVNTGNIGNAGEQNAQVILNFRHALSKVTVNLSSTNDNLTVKLTGVGFKNLYAKASFNFPRATTAPGMQTDASTVGNWTDLNTQYQYPIFMAQTLDEAIDLTPTPTDLSNTPLGGPRYMISQPLRYESEGSGADNCLVVMCSVLDAKTGQKLWPNQNTPPEDFVPGSTLQDGLLKFALSSSNVTEWKPGYHYIYNVVINANPDMGAIDFGTPTVDTFVDVETNY